MVVPTQPGGDETFLCNGFRLSPCPGPGKVYYPYGQLNARRYARVDQVTAGAQPKVGRGTGYTTPGRWLRVRQDGDEQQESQEADFCLHGVARIRVVDLFVQCLSR